MTWDGVNLPKELVHMELERGLVRLGHKEEHGEELYVGSETSVTLLRLRKRLEQSLTGMLQSKDEKSFFQHKTQASSALAWICYITSAGRGREI